MSNLLLVAGALVAVLLFIGAIVTAPLSYFVIVGFFTLLFLAALIVGVISGEW